MNLRSFFREYSLARRATLITVLTLLAMLALAGLTLATLFLRAQVEHSRLSALTQANVASSTVTAAVRFGGYEVIVDSLRAFDTGPGHDSVAVFDRKGKLIAQVVAPGESIFPVNLAEVPRLVSGVIDASPVQYPLRDDAGGGSGALLATLVVNPNQNALQAAVSRALVTLGVVLGITALAGLIVAQSLSRAMLRPVAELTTWAEEVSKVRNLATVAPMPLSGAQEVNRLTGSFERLVSQVAEQNRELKRKQYELKASNAHLETMAFSDSLTGLPNRPLFESRLTEAIDRANATGHPLALLFIDLDHLKAINDQFGHAVGDSALRATAARIRRALRGTDFLARLAGDEFVVISPNVTGVDDAVRLGERLTVWLGIALPEDRWTNPVRASVGVAVFPDHGEDVQSLVHAADLAMYRAKALPSDDSIRVSCATAAPRTQAPSRLPSNVVSLPASGRKSQVGKS